MNCISHICSTCRTDKPVTEFGHCKPGTVIRGNSNRPCCGYKYICRACRKEYQKQYQVSHRTNMNASRKTYQQKHKDKWIGYRHARRARLAGTGGTYSENDVDKLILDQSGKCNKCLCELIKFEVDHMVPVSKGGSNWPTNLQLLCSSCNRRKSDKIETNQDGTDTLSKTT